MFSKNTILLASAMLISLVACKKEEIQVNVPTVDNHALLTSGTWQMVAETADGEDIYKDYQDCEIDNTFTFNADGNAIFDEGNLKCDAAAEQTMTGNWAFLSQEKKKIMVNEINFTINADIMELNKTTMKWSFVRSSDNKYIVQTFTK